MFSFINEHYFLFGDLISFNTNFLRMNKKITTKMQTTEMLIINIIKFQISVFSEVLNSRFVSSNTICP